MATPMRLLKRISKGVNLQSHRAGLTGQGRANPDEVAIIGTHPSEIVFWKNISQDRQGKSNPGGISLACGRTSHRVGWIKYIIFHHIIC